MEHEKGFKNTFLTLTILLALFILPQATGYPPLPTETYGRAFTNNFNVSPGTKIEVLDQDDVVCGTFTVQNEGAYGLLTCEGDDPETPVDEGAEPGDKLSFEINDQPAASWENVTWQRGQFIRVNISIPVPECGDNLCDLHFEDALSCPADCDSGNGTGDVNDTNVSEPDVSPGGEGQGGGAGGGAGGGGGGGGGGGAAGGVTGGAFLPGQGPQQCEEKWNCTEWSECSINGTRTRTCEDINRCGTNESKPRTTESCDYIPTCFDGVKNGQETDIDCGGPCVPCSIGNACEQNQDCKTEYCVDNTCRRLSCEDPEIFCNDNMKTCGETGVDCGGPCDEECPQEEQPGAFEQVFACKKEVNPIDNKSIFFFIIILLSVLGKGYHTYGKLKDIEEEFDVDEDEEELSYDEEVKLIKKKFSEKRKFWLFTGVLAALSIILYLYYYYFFLCETAFKYIWWLVALVIAAPFIIHFALRIYEYREEDQIKKLKKLSDKHYQQVMRLIDIENTQLEEMEEEISQTMKELMDNKQFRQELNEFPEFKRIYSDMVDLYLEYRDNKTPYELERELCQEIYDLETDPHFRELAGKYPEIKGIYNRLRYLYQQYEEKQELYEQLDRIEEGWEAEDEEPAPEDDMGPEEEDGEE